MVILMFKVATRRNRLKRFSLKRVDPLAEQVRKVLTGTEQQLILMVRGWKRFLGSRRTKEPFSGRGAQKALFGTLKRNK